MFGADKKRCKKCGRESKQGETFAEIGSIPGGFLCGSCVGRVIQTEPQDNSWLNDYCDSLKSIKYPPLRIKLIKTEDDKKAWQIVDMVIPENIANALKLYQYDDEIIFYYRFIDKNTFSLCRNRGY